LRVSKCLTRVTPLALQPMIRLSVAGFGLAAIAAVAVVRLPYRTAQLTAVGESSAAPAADGSFHVGPMTWDVPRYAREPALEPLRAFFRAHCAGRSGFAAATCVSDAFAMSFGKGAPAHEFVDASYDPVVDLDAHLHGEVGHCVTRSGLVSAVLLAVGIPAKVVQILGASGSGHTVMSVWDAQRGWLVYDPSFGGLVGVGGKPSNVTGLVDTPEDLSMLPAGKVPGGGNPGDEAFYERLEGPGLTVLLPEPWLYMRVGEHRAHAPLRGEFAVCGAFNWRTGPAQSLARGTFAASFLLGLASLSVALVRKRRVAAVARPPEVAATALEPLEPAE
jgi:hypothetical protein